MSTSVALARTVSTAIVPANSGSSGGRQLSAQANEFEAMLLTQYLQSADSTFGSAPGEDDSASAGDDQIKSFALQQLATGIAAKGGIGIARYVSKALANTQSKSAPSPNGPMSGHNVVR